jgi:hypothetical protein
MSVEKLKAFELKYDSLVEQLDILKLPVRALLASMHLLADNLFYGTRMNSANPLAHPPRPEAGLNLASRFSHLIRLLQRCPTEPLGMDADNAINALLCEDPSGQEFPMLVNYGHFSDLMPEVHRGYYLVEGDEESGFVLSHPSAEFAHHEALDIILAELSLSMLLNSSETAFSSLFDGLAETAPLADALAMEQALRALNGHYRRYFNEPPYLTEDGYRAACGVGSEDFARFRAALLAMSDYAIGLSAALDRRIRTEGDPGNVIWKEMLEWISVCWTEQGFLGFLKALSGLEDTKLDRLVNLFSGDFRTGMQSHAHARDGFFPPLARLETCFLYSPWLLKPFMTARNIAFAVRHQDQKLFDEIVSSHLEPALVQQAAELFRSMPCLEVVPGRKWQKSEIDLLVYSPTENVALHIQAKAAIPPSGARMVQNLETRSREGLDQLNAFRKLNQPDRDAVLSEALGHQVDGVTVIDVLLSRSCFGTHKVWAQLGAVVPMNLAILAGVTKPFRAERRPIPLAELPRLAKDEIDRVMKQAKPKWVVKEAVMGLVQFRLPMLEYDNDAVRAANLRMWS